MLIIIFGLFYHFCFAQQPDISKLNHYFDVLQENNTFLGSGINIEKNECNSYKFPGKWKLEPETDISIPLGAGGLVSTPADLVQFSNKLFSGSIISDES